MPAWLIAAAAYSALEFYLGKTKRVKQNSTIEILLQGLKAVLGVIVAKGKK